MRKAEIRPARVAGGRGNLERSVEKAQVGGAVQMEKKGKRRRGRESGVGIRVFRDSLWSGADMGTHSDG